MIEIALEFVIILFEKSKKNIYTKFELNKKIGIQVK